MRRLVNALSLLLTFFMPAFGQITWERVFGGSNRDQAFSVHQTQDGGYVIAGFTGSFGHGCYDAYVVKTDAFGDTIWTRTYGTPNNDYCWSIEQTQDGGYVVLGATDSVFQTGPHDVYLVRINSLGDTLWSKVYGDTTPVGTTNDVGHEIHQTQDGGYIIVGSTESYGAGLHDVYLIKTNSSGDTLWTNTYGTTYGEYGESVQETSDDGYIVAGSGYASGNGDDAYLVKTDSVGNAAWKRLYGGVGSEKAQCVLQTQDGGYIFVGSTTSYGSGGSDLYLVKTNSNGDTAWTKTYGGAYNDWGNAIQQTQDGGYVVIGAKRTANPESCFIWLLKTDSLGDTLWTKIQNKRFANGMDIRPTQDGGYIIAAITWDFGGDDNFYLIKTDSTGSVGIEEKIKNTLRRVQSTTEIYPNPFIDFTRVQNYQEDNFIVFDINGRMVGRYRGNKIGIDLQPGVYFIQRDGRGCKPIGAVKLR